MNQVVALLSGLWVGACSVFGVRTVEEPRYTVRETVGPVEIRDYAWRVAAETVVPGNEGEALNTGFRRLAGYIFGGNHADRKIEMTAPVAQAPASAGAPGGQDIAMTAPVSQARAAGGDWTVRFFMPAELKLADLPAPNNPAVRLVQVPSETYAVLRFSGLAGPATVAAEQARLLGYLQGTKWQPHGAPVAWFYDPPWTIPPLRRNEVAVVVSSR